MLAPRAIRPRRRRTQAERTAETRSKLIDATVECLIGRGYVGTTTLAVCKRAGVSHGSMLHHLGTREALLGAALESVYGRLRARVVAGLEALPPGDARAAAMVDLMWSAFGAREFKAVLELWVAAANQPDVSWAVWPEARAFDAGNAPLAEQLFRSRQAMMTARLHEAGVRIQAGTDTLMHFVAPGSSLHGELDDLVAAGIAREDVWEIATRRAGHSLGLEGLGTLEAGAPADLVFIRADPAGDLGALCEIEAVMADGRLYRRTELDAMLATTDAHFHGAVYSAVMGAVIALVQHQFAPKRDASGSLGAQP